ncbi:hypothetical protein BGZ79_007879 [Entomortierella chlamydospora]|nr:hypothetical protein BGZ79_007879 [Entomortierella chlamydospora]
MQEESNPEDSEVEQESEPEDLDDEQDELESEELQDEQQSDLQDVQDALQCFLSNPKGHELNSLSRTKCMQTVSTKRVVEPKPGSIRNTEFTQDDPVDNDEILELLYERFM